MSEETFILTTKDLTILEVMLDLDSGEGKSLAPLLRRKINAALVMFRDDVPEDVATLSSRVRFRIDGREPETSIISSDAMASPAGMFLPISDPRGLALLGLAEGQEVRFSTTDGVEERILLEKVLYQPEAARRRTKAVARPTPARPGKPLLRLVPGAALRRAEPAVAGPDGFDDPGPSAA